MIFGRKQKPMDVIAEKQQSVFKNYNFIKGNQIYKINELIKGR